IQVAGKPDGLTQAHQLLEHGRKPQYGQGQRQRDPEAFPEIGGHVGVMILMVLMGWVFLRHLVFV
ncbi:MAG TPA: hypothetical protein VMV78_16450, partial [Thiobacillus sp.]|nr:hypothetical protein [Thiobacillus sp.]